MALPGRLAGQGHTPRAQCRGTGAGRGGAESQGTRNVGAGGGGAGERLLRQWAFSAAATTAASTGSGTAALFSAGLEQSPRLGLRSAHTPRPAPRATSPQPLARRGRTRIVRTSPHRGAETRDSSPARGPLESQRKHDVNPQSARHPRRERRTGPEPVHGGEGWCCGGGARRVPAAAPSRLPPWRLGRRAMASPEERFAPRPQAPLPAAGDEPGRGQVRQEPRRGEASGWSAVGLSLARELPGCGREELAAPPPLSRSLSPAGHASPAGGPSALSALSAGGCGWVAARAPSALAFSSPIPSSSFSSSWYFWPPPPLPPPPLVPSSSAFHLPVRLPRREGAAAAGGGGGGGDAGGGGGGGGQEAAPLSVPPGSSHRSGGGSGGRRQLFLSPAILGLLLPARAGPRPPPPPPRLPLHPGARRTDSPGFPGAGGGCPGLGPGSAAGGRTPWRPRGAAFPLATAWPLLFGSDMEDGPSNNASCFRRLTECFLSPSKWSGSTFPAARVVSVLVGVESGPWIMGWGGNCCGGGWPARCVCTRPRSASGPQEAGGTSVAFGTAGQRRDTGLSQAPSARRGRVNRRVSGARHLETNLLPQSCP